VASRMANVAVSREVEDAAVASRMTSVAGRWQVQKCPV
jgi:hypothetical protein